MIRTTQLQINPNAVSASDLETILINLDSKARSITGFDRVFIEAVESALLYLEKLTSKHVISTWKIVSVSTNKPSFKTSSSSLTHWNTSLGKAL